MEQEMAEKWYQYNLNFSTYIFAPSITFLLLCKAASFTKGKMTSWEQPDPSLFPFFLYVWSQEEKEEEEEEKEEEEVEEECTWQYDNFYQTPAAQFAPPRVRLCQRPVWRKDLSSVGLLVTWLEWRQYYLTFL